MKTIITLIIALPFFCYAETNSILAPERAKQIEDEYIKSRFVQDFKTDIQNKYLVTCSDKAKTNWAYPTFSHSLTYTAECYNDIGNIVNVKINSEYHKGHFILKSYFVEFN